MSKANLTVVEQEYRTIVQECAEQGKRLATMLANNGSLEPLYLYARPSEPRKPGKLFLARESAPNSMGYKLVTKEGLHSNVPYENYFTWVYDRAKRAPVLSIDD